MQPQNPAPVPDDAAPDDAPPSSRWSRFKAEIPEMRDRVALTALMVFVVSLTASGLAVSWALGFGGLALASLLVAGVLGWHPEEDAEAGGE